MKKTLQRRNVVKALLKDRGKLLVVAGLGSTAWDCTAAGDHPLTFPLWGAMGNAAMMGLGLALAQPRRRVLVITGDGEMPTPGISFEHVSSGVEVGGLAVGTWRVAVSCIGYAPSDFDARIPSPGSHVEVDVVLTPLSDAGTLVLEVEGDTGLNPVLHARRRSPDQAMWRSLGGRWDPEGGPIRVPGLPAGRYDLFVLASRFEFDGPRLGDAIRATFARRNTDMPEHEPIALRTEFAQLRDKPTQWRAFVRRSRLLDKDVALATVVEHLHRFLWPVALGLLNAHAMPRAWPAGGPWS